MLRGTGTAIVDGDETRVSYRERIIPTAVVGTDPARADAVTASFVSAANDLATSRGLTRVRATGGYVPPVLLDVWARAPYGHVGQSPSLQAMATAPDERPRRFIVDPNALYDLGAVGVRHETATRRLRGDEYLSDGSKPGLGVGGHPYLARLPAEERGAVSST